MRLVKLAVSIALLLALLGVNAGCAAKVRSVHVALEPRPGYCQAIEVRPSGLSTIVTLICWDAQGNTIGMGAAGGKPSVSVPLDIVQSAASVAGPVVGAYILGTNLVKAAGNVGGTVNLKASESQIQQATDAINRATK